MAFDITQPYSIFVTAGAWDGVAANSRLFLQGGSYYQNFPPYTEVTPDTSYTPPGLTVAEESSLRALVSGAGNLQLKAGQGIVFLGDSITQASDIVASDINGVSWPNYASIYSGQRLQLVRNAGISGNRIAQMIARFDTDVAPYAPRVVVVLAGTNNVTDQNTVAEFAAWYVQLMAKINAIGAVPICCTIPPTGSTTGINRQLCRLYSEWIKRYALTNGYRLLDFYSLLVDPTTGSYLSAYDSGDGTHPSTAGYGVMGSYASTQLSEFFGQTSTIPLCSNTDDPINSIYNGCFTASSGSAPSLGWLDNAGTPAGSVISYGTATGVQGKVITFTHTAVAAVRQSAYTLYCGETTVSTAASAGDSTLITAARADYRGILFIGSGSTFEIARIASSSGGGPQTQTLEKPLRFSHSVGEPVICNAKPGDVMAWSGIVSADGGIMWNVFSAMTGAAYSPAPGRNMAAGPVITKGVFGRPFALPAATTQIQLRLEAGTGTGVVSFGQIGLFNMTRLGLI